MEIIIPGLLPPPNVAPELTRYVESDCPALVERFLSGLPSVTPLDPELLGCTPFEWLKLRRAGFKTQPRQTFGSNMALLLTGTKAIGEVAFIAELTSVNVGRDRMSIVHPDLIGIDQTECDQLFESVANLWSDTNISALPINPKQWRIWLPDNIVLHSMTPSSVAENSLSDWWPQDRSARDWRRLLNEIQMVWHDHPVNEQRQQQGKLPINSLWLFGGAARSHDNPEVQHTDPVQIIDTLAIAHATHDWAQWIAKLPQLNAQVRALANEDILSLTGHDKLVSLTPVQARWWHGLLKPKRRDWKLWWTNQN